MFKMTFHQKLLTLVYSCQVVGIAGLIYYWDPMYLLWTLLGKTLFHSIGTEVALHRMLAHRSFKTAKWKERSLAMLSTFGLWGSILGWCANHRVHHRNSDKENDPHPSKEWFKTWFWIDTEKNARPSPTIVKDLIKDPFYKWQREHYFKIILGTYATSALVFGPEFTLYFFILTGALAQFSGGLINVVCHKWGYRNYETSDYSRNNLWVNLYNHFFGVGLHNNHHQYPGSYTTRVGDNPKWYEIDLGAVLIRNFLIDKDDPILKQKPGNYRTEEFLKNSGADKN